MFRLAAAVSFLLRQRLAASFGVRARFRPHACLVHGMYLSAGDSIEIET
jgi:hypothetical protein